LTFARLPGTVTPGADRVGEPERLAQREGPREMNAVRSATRTTTGTTATRCAGVRSG